MSSMKVQNGLQELGYPSGMICRDWGASVSGLDRQNVELGREREGEGGRGKEGV